MNGNESRLNSRVRPDSLEVNLPQDQMSTAIDDILISDINNGCSDGFG